MKTKMSAIGLIALLFLSLPSIVLAKEQNTLTVETQVVKAEKFSISFKDRLLKVIDNVSDRLESAAEMLKGSELKDLASEGEKNGLLAKIEIQLKDYSILRGKVVSAASMEEMKEIASEVKEKISYSKALLKYIYGFLEHKPFHKIMEAIEKSGETAHTMQEKIGQLHKMGVSTKELEKLKELFEEKISEAKALVEKAMILHEQDADKGEIMEFLKLAKEEVKDAFSAKESFKNLYERLLLQWQNK